MKSIQGGGASPFLPPGLLLVTTILLGSSTRLSTTTEALQVHPPLSLQRNPRRPHVSDHVRPGKASTSSISTRNGVSSFPLESALFQSTVLSSTAEMSGSSESLKGKPRFVIEKVGGGGSRRAASSHASYYYGDYVTSKVYSDISNLCVQNFFGTTERDIQQSIQTSTQKLELFQSLQPDELRRRRDDVKITSEFFVAYELTEATPEDVEEFRREQELQREQERLRMKNGAKQNQVHYNAHGNDHYYRVDHSIKSPAKMANGYEPYSNRPQGAAAGDVGPVVMGGTLGGVAGRRQAREQANARTQRPLRRYRSGSSTASDGAGSAWNSFPNTRSNDGGGTREYHNSYSSTPFYDPYTMEEIDDPLVMGGNLGSVGPSTRRRQQRRTSQRGTMGPLFAYRRYHQYQHDFEYFQQPQSTQRAVSNNEEWGVEQPFMVDHGHNYNVETGRYDQHVWQNFQEHRHQSPMPHEATSTAHHTYSSIDGGMNFEYHYNPNVDSQQISSVQEYGLPIDDKRVRSTRPKDAPFQAQPQSRPTKPTSPNRVESSHFHSPAAGAVHEKEAPMWVKGNLVGFVEVVHVPYSLGDLDDPDMLTAGMKPHRAVLRNLVVAKHARNSGIGTRLLEACERHVQNHWQMNELVAEVDDLWSESNNGSVQEPVSSTESPQTTVAYTTPSAVSFYEKFGYEVVLSDPESKRYDEETGEITGQIQCRRDVMRKMFEGDDKSYKSVTTKGKDAKQTNFNGIKSHQYSETALDVEYEPTGKDSKDTVQKPSRMREDINDPAPCAAELITDPTEGPRPSGSSSKASIACDPEGPNQSIFSSYD
ncbi:acetyltransferase GNAT domain containing protein [Nitzschia inconspicua]|uniref:Acetyltransferase GNAT domain containing protein n=1 Tax=Nitzschia inconspicua TaxID=303405 RepID=A0A9K3KWK1_9STRA|nr:acetyltransferase GNAT domain containing protein [Nitzschia inconspicua]